MTKFKKKKNNKIYEKGIALVEVIAAMGVATVVITALVSLSISTLRTSLNSKLLLEGSEIANREIELVRGYRDANTWVDFISNVKVCTSSNPCSMNIGSPPILIGQPTEDGSGAEKLTRSFTATRPDGTAVVDGDSVVRISVSVTWQIGDQTKSAYIYTDLTNWRDQ